MCKIDELKFIFSKQDWLLAKQSVLISLHLSARFDLNLLFRFSNHLHFYEIYFVFSRVQKYLLLKLEFKPIFVQLCISLACKCGR